MDENKCKNSCDSIIVYLLHHMYGRWNWNWTTEQITTLHNREEASTMNFMKPNYLHLHLLHVKAKWGLWVASLSEASFSTDRCKTIISATGALFLRHTQGMITTIYISECDSIPLRGDWYTEKTEAMNLERMSQIPEGTIWLPAHELLCLWWTCGWKWGYRCHGQLIEGLHTWIGVVGRTNNTCHAYTGRGTNLFSCHTELDPLGHMPYL